MAVVSRRLRMMFPAILLLLLALLSVQGWTLVSANRHKAGTPNTPIKHVVIIMMENHTFDNMFGTFPGANGVTLTRAPNPLSADINHQAPALLAAIDGGKMDEFSSQAYVQYVKTDIPTYWDYATHFGLGDNFFTSAATNSAPNHVSMIAGQTGGSSRVQTPVAATVNRMTLSTPALSIVNSTGRIRATTSSACHACLITRACRGSIMARKISGMACARFRTNT